MSIRRIDGSEYSPGGVVDIGGGPPHDGDMEARVAKLEADITAIKIDVAVIKANGATKSDIAELKGVMGELRMGTKADLSEVKGGLKADIAEAKVSIIIWVVSAIFLAQLLPSLLKIFVP